MRGPTTRIAVRGREGQELANEMTAAVTDARDGGKSLLAVEFQNGELVLVFEPINPIIVRRVDTRDDLYHRTDPYYRPDPYARRG